jgi:hypothetical protein
MAHGQGVLMANGSGMQWEQQTEVFVEDKMFFQRQNKTALIRFYKRRIRSLCHMNYFALFFFVLSTLSATATPPNVHSYKSSRGTFNGPDRTITWRPWREGREGDYRFRTGDRYLGNAQWEHYLGFEQHPGSTKAIKLSMIRLGSEDVGEEVVIRPGSRYGILKVTNGDMTAHKGVWSWTAQEID